jgi:hypothetical protein
LNELCGACALEALQKLNTMRQAEGRSLAVEMNRLLSDIAEKTKQAEVLTELSRPAYALRLQTRLAELLGGVALDPARLAQEAALLAERADVTEELARLRSHIEQFGKTVAAAGEIGKKLDFLLQEMQREANTFLSKTPGLGDAGLAMTVWVCKSNRRLRNCASRRRTSNDRDQIRSQNYHRFRSVRIRQIHLGAKVARPAQHDVCHLAHHAAPPCGGKPRKML